MTGANADYGQRDHDSSGSIEGVSNGETGQHLPEQGLLSQILASADGENVDAAAAQVLRDELNGLKLRFGCERKFDNEIAVAMVSVVTSRIRSLKSPLSDTLVDWVTTTLCDDPVSRSRMEKIWSELTGRSEYVD